MVAYCHLLFTSPKFIIFILTITTVFNLLFCLSFLGFCWVLYLWYILSTLSFSLILAAAATYVFSKFHLFTRLGFYMSLVTQYFTLLDLVQNTCSRNKKEA